MNESDGERIASLLDELNYHRVYKEAEADLVVVVACSVRQAAVDRIYGRAKQWKAMKKKKKLITALSGCVVKEDQDKLKSVFDIFFEIKDLNSLPARLGEYFHDTKSLEQTDDSYFKIQPKYSSSFQAYVPISTGCNNFCTFCVVPYTRGREKSRPASDIIKEVRHLLEYGYKEIVLLGQNVNSYGLDTLPPRMVTPEGQLRFKDVKPDIDFPKLLKQVARLPFEFWIRFITSNPQDMSDELIKVVAEEPNCLNYIHLPIQAGDDQVLKRMNRRHTIDHYKKLVDKIKSQIPDVALTTDVIVGFCGETDQQFQNTLELFKDIKYDMAYTAQYSHRPGTGAYKALKDDVPEEVKEQREIQLTNVLRDGALEQNQKLVNKELIVLVDTFRKGNNLGKTEGNKTVKFQYGQDLRGQFVRAKITSARPWGLAGELLATNLTARGNPQ